MKRYTRTSKYDEKWIKENWMGPNPLILLEELALHMDLKPGMKVLDMGCGKGLTSIFLAKEFGVTVFANDLWISPTDNLKRFEEAGVAQLVYPIHAEAHLLPYAEGFFDAVIAVDSYQYFGADEMYLPQVLSKLVKKNGQLGIVVPGFKKEFEKGYPETLKEFWEPEMFSFHSREWWYKLWDKTGLVEVMESYNLEDTFELWKPWAIWSKENLGFKDLEFINADTEKDLSFIVMTAKRV